MRLFIAATFPEPELRAVNDRINAVKPKLPAASWVRPETQHLTFAFLGEQPESITTTLTPLLEQQLANIERFNATLAGSGFFPNSRHARVAWVGVTPEDKLRAIAAAVRAAVTTAGLAATAGEFKPHLTICRIRDPWPPACVETFNGALRGYESQPFAVDGVTLFSSELHSKGAIHTPLHTFALAS
jgi:2'-5' RNA ligase